MSKKDSYLSYMAKCPFYEGEQRQVIYCAGLSENQKIHLAFAGSPKEHLNNYCRKDWLKCPIAQMLWDREDKKMEGG